MLACVHTHVTCDMCVRVHVYVRVHVCTHMCGSHTYKLSLLQHDDGCCSLSTKLTYHVVIPRHQVQQLDKMVNGDVLTLPSELVVNLSVDGACIIGIANDYRRKRKCL